MAQDNRSLKSRSALLSASFAFAGLLAYAVMALSKRALSPSDFSAFSVFWSFGFFLTATVGFPVEQELSRSVASRDTNEQEFGDVVDQAIRIAVLLGAIAITMAIGVALSGVLTGLERRVEVLMALAVLICGESATAVVRGVLAGTRQTLPFALMVAGQGVVRLALVVLALVIAPDGLWPSVAVASSSLTFVLFLGRLLRTRTNTSPPFGVPGLSRAGLFRLLGAAPFSAVFSVGTPALAGLVAKRAEQAEIGDVLAALSFTSSPVLVAAALQTTLLPSLVRSLLVDGDRVVRRSMRRITGLVVGIFALAAVAISVVGPALLRLLFGSTPGVGRLALSGMTMAAGLLFLTNVLTPVCIARRSHSLVARAWALGAATLVLLINVPGRLADRVAISVLGGAIVVAGSMVLALNLFWGEGASGSTRD